MKPADIKALRIAMGCHYRKDFAEKLGVSVQAVEHWEYGRANLPQPVYFLLGYILHEHFSQHPNPVVIQWRAKMWGAAQEPWQDNG